MIISARTFNSGTSGYDAQLCNIVLLFIQSVLQQCNIYQHVYTYISVISFGYPIHWFAGG